MFRTHVQCEGCRKRVHTWYDMGDEEGCFCPCCYVVWYPDLATSEDFDRAEEFEANGG